MANLDLQQLRRSTSRRDFLRYTAILGASGVLGSSAGVLSTAPSAAANPLRSASATTPTKTASTIYTPPRVAAARQNIQDFDWAQTLRDDAVAAAEPFLAQGDEWLWSLVTGQTIPRSTRVSWPNIGSPITGMEIYQNGAYPWLIDVINEPWKITEPLSGHTFPTNDFEAYYRSGLDEHGVFNPGLADRDLLVNELYPEMGQSWGVDDGYGWVDDDGNKWTFIAYYNQFALWLDGPGQPQGRLTPHEGSGIGAIHIGLKVLRDAFVYTGDVQYAHAGLILLDRVADIYPTLDLSAYPRADGYGQGGDGGGGTGRAVGRIWEAAFLAKDLARAYDAFFPAIADGDDADVVRFLAAKAEEHDLPAKDSVDAIKVNIENGLLREIYAGVQARQIQGNFGFHQETLTTAAVVLDDPEGETREWLNFVFQTGGLAKDPPAVTGGDVYRTLVTDVDRDGFGDEAAPSYLESWVKALGQMADVLDGYDPELSLYEHPKYAKMIWARTQLTMLNRYRLSIGDSYLTGNPMEFDGGRFDPQDFVRYFDLYDEGIYARYAYLLNRDSFDGLYGDIFTEDVLELQQRIQDAVDAGGPLNLAAVNLTGYGLAALRAGWGEHMRDVWLYYGRSGGKGGADVDVGHPHRDSLNLGMHALGVDLLPDIGYPHTPLFNDSRQNDWTKSTVSHNTVLVDADRSRGVWGGTPQGFAATNRVQYVDVESPLAYRQASIYRRAVAFIAIDETASYAVDVFRILGGSEHHFSFHAAPGEVETEGLNLAPQETGTYAGPDIEVPPPNTTSDPDSAGFEWLFNVERDDAPAGPFSVDWAVRDVFDVHEADPDIHVRMTMLNDVDDVALADGVVPDNRPWDPPQLRYVLAHRGEPAPPEQYIDDDDPAVEYTGGWPHYEPDAAVGGGLRLSNANTPNASVTVRWTGGRAQYIGSANHSGQVHGLATVTLDGEDKGVVSFSRPQQVYQEVMFDTGELEEGEHTLTVTALGEKGEYAGEGDVGIRISFDALRLVGPENPALASQFVSVIEPYQDQRTIESMQLVPVTPRGGDSIESHEVAAIRVELTNGRTDYVVQSLRPDVLLDVDDGALLFRGAFGVYSLERGRPVYAVHHDATMLAPAPRMQAPRGAATGELTDFTRDLSDVNELIIALDHDVPYVEDLVGSYVYVDNDGVRNASYQIHAARLDGDLVLVLDIGDATTIRGYADDDDFDAGYRYDIEEGAAIRIPLTREWQR